ncbi:MAG TPA: 2-isopropylmalate synthase [Firmicutes bacterium]|nr:2-isopropylmalate synthase [Bacillota bacterium]
MIYHNSKSNLLEVLESNYVLQDISQPNLYRDIYRYDEVPKVTFNHTHVPIHMPDQIFITDTSFRDGQQSRVPYTVKQIKQLYTFLHQLGGPKGIVSHSEFFLYSKKDREAVYECLSLGYQTPVITSWIRANKDDFKLVKEVGLSETGILVSCSDYHIFKKMKKSRSQAFDHYLGIIKEALNQGIVPRCHLEDITRADFYGFVVPFARALSQLSQESGIPIKVRACDTMGYGVTYPGAALPRSVQGIIYGLRHHAHFESEHIEWHGHNDFYKAVQNATSAWLYGASNINCTMLGIGERTGNTPLEAMVFEYAQLRGTLDGMDTTVITDIADYYEKEIGYKVPNDMPFVGQNFNVTRAGIHADGLLKDEEIYNIFDTDKLLKRPPQVAVSSYSGLAGIAHWINGYYQLKGDEKVDKYNDIVFDLKQWVDEQFASGRNGVLTDEELAAWVAEYKGRV